MTLHRPLAPTRTLMGPGPLDIHPRVYQALASPVIGHLDPAYSEVLDSISEHLRNVFRTKNALTHASPGTGTSGMEICISNLIEPGDRVLVCSNGYFGDRLQQVAESQSADITRIEGEWGNPIDPARIEDVLRSGQFKLMTLVHAETSTGVLQPMDDIAQLAKEHGVMIVLDTVTSLGGVDVRIDDWGIDAAYSCSQKCLGSPSGLAPVTLSERAIASVKSRKHKVPSFYLDVLRLQSYWTHQGYHHTSSSTLHYGLLEALALIEEEGLENRHTRHLRHNKALVAGIEAMGLQMLVAREHRLPSLSAICIPNGVNDATLRSYLLSNFNLEIGGGLGKLKGKVWRIGLMGFNSSAEKILFALSCLHQAMAAQGHRSDLKASLAEAMSVLNQEKKNTVPS